MHTFNKRRLSKYKFGEISPAQLKVWNFALWWAPFIKIISKFQLKKVQKTYFSWHWWLMQSLKKNWLVVSYGMKNLVNFQPTTQKSKNYTWMGYFCPKYTRFELKKYRGVIFHDTKQWFKILINSELVVSKMAWTWVNFH